MERIIARHIYDHLIECDLLSNMHHGFVRKRSTCTNLLASVNDWTTSVQNKKSVTIAYIDFIRAFDSVSHDKLFAHLYSYGIRANVLKWLINFFCNRTHQTRVGQYLSAVAKLQSGVVQGNGVGPVIFLIYIDELAKLLKSHGITAKLFADDVKVYVEIVNTVDACKWQTALDLIAEWAATWQLQVEVSVNKCNILHFGSVQCSIDYFIDDVELPNNKRCHDLGVHVIMINCSSYNICLPQCI